LFRRWFALNRSSRAVSLAIRFWSIINSNKNYYRTCIGRASGFNIRMGSVRRQIAGLCLSFLVGCSHDYFYSAPPPTTEPIATQVQRAAPDLKGQRFSNLLNFEMPADTIFVSTTDLKISADESTAHTGRSSLKIIGNSGQIKIKLSSLMRNRPFPDKWTLVGAYFYSEKSAGITTICEVSGQVIAKNTTTLPPHTWTAAMADLSDAPGTDSHAEPSFSFLIDGRAPVWCDDVMLIDNTKYLFGNGTSSDQWSIAQSGFNIFCIAPGAFSTRLKTADSTPAGWRLEEANALRARFSSDGTNKRLTIYRDGRSYWDGEFRALSVKVQTEPAWRDEQNSPAEIEVPEFMGRVNRRSDGDANNDGYNESRASYQIIATGPRLQMKIIPRSVAVLAPTFEIAGFPPGNVLVTIEGRLIENTLRLQDGTLLVQIPARIERPTTVDLRVEEPSVR
jgi:hypothetical protein